MKLFINQTLVNSRIKARQFGSYILKWSPCQTSARVNGIKNPNKIKTLHVKIGFCSALLLIFAGCAAKGAIDTLNDAIDQIAKARESAVAQSDAWRTALPQLVDQLGQLEGQATADSKAVITDARNQVQELVTESIKFMDVTTKEIVATTGAEFRCNTDFAMSGVAARLQDLIEDLKVWQKTRHHSVHKPAHKLCQIIGQTLSLYPIENGRYSIDSSKLMGLNVVGVFGYNFRQDALPRLELMDGSGKRLRDLAVSLAYVTQYQLTLNFSTETFTGVTPGAKVRLVWPDSEEVNEISLSLFTPAKLKITNHAFTPQLPIATKDAVQLNVTVQNVGGMRTGGFNLNWAPQGGRVQAVSLGSLNPDESRQVQFPATTVFQTQGRIGNVVSISTGDDTQTFFLDVGSNIASIRPYRIDKPPVNALWTPTAINVTTEDKVEIVAAGGCVNTGGSGATTKRYVDPLDANCRPTKNYYGTIAIPGTVEEAQKRSIQEFMKNGSVTVKTPTTIKLGYIDDKYDDNGYWGMEDQGNCQQCRGAGNAFVIIKVTHFK
jgi:hypothetical protein